MANLSNLTQMVPQNVFLDLGKLTFCQEVQGIPIYILICKTNHFQRINLLSHHYSCLVLIVDILINDKLSPILSKYQFYETS